MVSNQSLQLKAPVSGVAVSLENIPDPVFSQKMVGDGISIDPTSSCLLAPCEGEIIQLHSAAHAVTIKTAVGVDILMHIGLDTVNLKAKGFTPKVKVGQHVKTGDPLIEFDPDYLALNAKSLLTEIIVMNNDLTVSLVQNYGFVTAGKDTVLTISFNTSTQIAPVVSSETTVTSDIIVIPNSTGLHARPSAVLANLAKKFSSDIRIQRGKDQANAKSVVSIISLEVGMHDKVTLLAKGADAQEAINALAPALAGGLGDDPSHTASTIEKQNKEKAEKHLTPNAYYQTKSNDPNLLQGAAASPGVAVGNIFQVRHDEINVKINGEDIFEERQALDHALGQAKLQLNALQDRLTTDADPGKAAIFSAHQELLEDPELLDMTINLMEKGRSAAFAWKQAFNSYAEQMASLKNELLAARANDLRDVGVRVLRVLTNTAEKTFELPSNIILVAEELTPSDTANIDKSKVVGFCTTTGGASSHVAILARSLDIPAVAGIDPRALDVANGTPVILNGAKGFLRLNPSPQDIAHIYQKQEIQAQQRKVDMESAFESAITKDGKRIHVVANIGGLTDAQDAVRMGTEGVGLLRSEFVFMGRTVAPSEEEQTAVYESIVKVLGPKRPLIIRTLDIGGDKPLAYLPIPKEDNPFLGERGIRFCIAHSEILRTQIRAILKASLLGPVSIMFPMISTIPELRAAKTMVEEERIALKIPPIPIGIMVEVPAAAIMAEQFAKESDFFSIGSNDLTQYTLAMDRGHPKLAPLVDGLNPAVLSLIAAAVRGAQKYGKWVGVCGGIASDPHAVPLLIGLGVTELSVSIPVLPSIKAQVRRLQTEDCIKMAKIALEQDTASAVRAMFSDENS